MTPAVVASASPEVSMPVVVVQVVDDSVSGADSSATTAPALPSPDRASGAVISAGGASVDVASLSLPHAETPSPTRTASAIAAVVVLYLPMEL
jgi:hypothetical protein